jgi:protoporphyrin/coproporphyrin ferrochelatase
VSDCDQSGVPPSAPESAVLLLAYGGPDSLDDVGAYVLDVRGGRPTPPDLVAEMRRRYALIGGRSPLLEITRRQASALEQRLNADGQSPRVRTYVGMRHWHPYIRDVLPQIVADGIHHVVALCMAPHYSKLSVGAYIQKVREAQEGLDDSLDITFVPSWYSHPLFIQAVVNRVKSAIKRFPREMQAHLTYVFTAHSLPSFILDQGDPYGSQLRETARMIAGQLGLHPTSWQFCYQSAPPGQTAWLGPSIKDVVVDLARSGRTNILVTPIGFVADHVEVLYDVDIEARGLAEQAGARLERSESLNAADDFIEALADIVRDRPGEAQPSLLMLPVRMV